MAEFFLSGDLSAADLRRVAGALAALSLVAAAAILLWRRARPGHCARCGHDLRGIASGRCPECGSECGHARQVTPSAAPRLRLERFRGRAAATLLAFGLGLAALGWFAAPVTAWIKSRAAESLSDRELGAYAMKPDGGDARAALTDRARAIASGTRAFDGSLADADALRSVLDAPMVNPILITEPITGFSSALEEEFRGRFSAVADMPALLQDKLSVARELILDKGSDDRDPMGIVTEEQILSTLLQDQAVLSALAEESLAHSVFRFSPRAMVLREGTIVRWLLGPEDPLWIRGFTVFSSVFVRSARMRCAGGEGRVIELELVVAMQPVPGGMIPFIELMVPEGVCDEGEFILELELTPASVHGAADGSSSLVIETIVPFGYDSPRIPASR